MQLFSFKFYLNTYKQNGDKTPIYLRVITGQKKAEKSLSVSVAASDFDEAKGRTKKNAVINARLTDIESKLHLAASDYARENKIFTPQELIDAVFSNVRREKYLIEYFEEFIKDLETKNEIKAESIRSYKSAKLYVKHFLDDKHDKRDITIDRVNTEFVNDFDVFLFAQGLQKNTVGKYHKRLKRVLAHALSDGIIHVDPYSKFKIRTVTGKREFLVKNEIDSLMSHDLGGNDSLQRVRDIFIFSVYTGLRFSDAEKLTKDNLKQDANGNEVLLAYQEKTGDPVYIPILPQAKAIIDRYDTVERKITGRLLPKYSNQKLNAYLKMIGELCKIQKKLTHHVARHTCATHFLSSGVPIEAVSKFLGHSNMKSTQHYARITNSFMHSAVNNLKDKL